MKEAHQAEAIHLNLREREDRRERERGWNLERAALARRVTDCGEFMEIE